MSDYDVTVIDSEEILSSFIQDTCTDDINRIRREYPNYRSLHIDIKSLRDYSKEGAMVVDKILHRPRDMKDTIIGALVLDKIIFDEEEKSRNIEVRYIHLPDKLPIREIRSDSINTLISVEGMVKQVTDVKPEVVVAMFQCSSCGHRVREPQEIGEMKFPPDTCPTCGGKRYEPLPHHHQYKDIQKLRVQESPEGLRAGEQPRTIEVKLEDELVDSVTAGMRCTINGILYPIPQGKKSLVYDLYIDCCSIEKERDTYSELEITPEDVDRIMEIAADPDLFTKIGQSIAPSVYGNEVVKEAITLMLFGGVRKVLPSGDILRGDSHILLVGDPGIAKSQLLRRLVSISPRSAYVSGRGASAAGLTAAAVKEEFGGESRWVLEAGALVMADGGIAAVDEMDKMNKDDRGGLHEAMESQTISISKAGINATLQCRCALIGAANPKMGRFDDYMSLGEQIDMPPSLLSRFDLIFILTDKPNVKTDYDIGRHILGLHRKGQMLNSGEVVPEESMTPYDTETLRKYIAYAKSHVFPIGDEQTDAMILDHYVRIRGLSGKDKPITIAPRQLEALVRLSEASARVRLSDRIEIEDVKRALSIFDACMKQVAYDSETGMFDIDRVMTSTPKKTRDNVVALLDIVRKHADGLGYAAREQVVISLMATGKPIDEAEALIDKALQATVIMEPRRGYLKVV